MTHTTLKFASLAALGLSVVGCASRPAPVAPAIAHRAMRPPAPSTAALAFTPAIADEAEDLDLSRDGRQTVAYAGYEQQVSSVTYTRQDDRQRWGRYGDQSMFERRSVSTTVTVRGH